MQFQFTITGLGYFNGIMSHKTGTFHVSKFFSYLNVLEQFGIGFWSLMILIIKTEKIMTVFLIRLTKKYCDDL